MTKKNIRVSVNPPLPPEESIWRVIRSMRAGSHGDLLLLLPREVREEDIFRQLGSLAQAGFISWDRKRGRWRLLRDQVRPPLLEADQKIKRIKPDKPTKKDLAKLAERVFLSASQAMREAADLRKMVEKIIIIIGIIFLFSACAPDQAQERGETRTETINSELDVSLAEALPECFGPAVIGATAGVECSWDEAGGWWRIEFWSGRGDCSAGCIETETIAVLRVDGQGRLIPADRVGLGGGVP
jgi:hypothetical protein